MPYATLCRSCYWCRAAGTPAATARCRRPACSFLSRHFLLEACPIDDLAGARAIDLDSAHFRLDHLALEIDMQQSALQGGTCDLDTLGQHEAALELARGDAAMQIDPALVVDLLTTNYELTILDLHQIGRASCRERVCKYV